MTIELSKINLETIADVFHEFKDYHRGNPSDVMAVMVIEKKLVEQTNGVYKPDTTYDVK